MPHLSVRAGNHSEVVAMSGNIAKAHQRGEEEHGERSQFQQFPESREFPGDAFRVPEMGKSLIALDDFIA